MSTADGDTDPARALGASYIVRRAWSSRPRWSSALVVVPLRAGQTPAGRRTKADQLIAALSEAGCARPDRRTRSSACSATTAARSATNPNGALSRAIAATACSPTARPDPGSGRSSPTARVVQGELLIIKVYCPDKLADFQEFVDDLKTDRRGER